MTIEEIHRQQDEKKELEQAQKEMEQARQKRTGNVTSLLSCTKEDLYCC